MNYFGENFKRLRKDKGLNQEQLAEIFNVADRSTISRWETGVVEPDLNTLIEISEFFKVSLDELVKKEYKMKTFLDEMKVAHNELAKAISKIENFSRVSEKSLESLSCETAQKCIDEGQVCVYENNYLEAVKYFEKAGALGNRQGYCYAMSAYEKLAKYYFDVGEIEEGAWCLEKKEICEMRMME